FEGDAFEGDVSFLLTLREMSGADGVGNSRQAMAGPQLGRQSLDHIRRPAASLLGPVPYPLRFQGLSGGMDRDDGPGPRVLSRGRVLRAGRGVRSRTLPLATPGREHFVLAHPKAAFGDLAREQKPSARVQFLRHPRLVEPGGLGVGAVVADFDGGDREARTAERAWRRAEDFDQDGAGLAVLEIG